MREITFLLFWLLDRIRWRRERREASKLEELERAEAAADQTLFSADPGFAAELGYQPAPYPKPDRYQKPLDARSAAFAAAMQGDRFVSQMQAMQQQMQGERYMQQLAARGIGFGGAGQLSRQQAGMLGNALGGQQSGLLGMGLGQLGDGRAGIGLFGNGMQQVTLRNVGFSMQPMQPMPAMQKAPKDPNVGAALDGLISLYCAETIPCTCGAPETRDPTFHHGYCAIWQRKA